MTSPTDPPVRISEHPLFETRATNLEPDGRSYSTECRLQIKKDAHALLLARSAVYKKKTNAERSADRCYLIAGHPGHLLWVPLYHTAYETMTNERPPRPSIHRPPSPANRCAPPTDSRWEPPPSRHHPSVRRPSSVDRPPYDEQRSACKI